jgi:molybdenum cofactor cytidylyltransferase
MRFRPTIVIPAAGSGSRFGGNLHKLAQPFGASTVLGTTLRNALSTQLPVVVVTTAALAPLVARQLALRDIVVATDEQAARGMGHTLSLGIGERSGAPGWLVLPADMPLVKPGTLLAVGRALEHHPVAYAQHKGRRGHPVGFAAELYSELVMLTGDNGARRVMLRYPAHAEDTDDAGVLMDIDTASDLDALRTAAGGSTPPPAVTPVD